MSKTFLILLTFIYQAALFADNIKIVYISDFSGETAKELLVNFNGTQLAVKEINEQGGILGRQLELISLDNQGSVLQTKVATEQAIKLKPAAILGCPYSSYALAAAEICQKNKIPLITETATHPDVTKIGNFIFRICFTDEFQGSALAQFAINDLKAKTAVVLIDASSPYSTGLADIFEQTFTAKRGKIIGRYSYQGSEKDFSHSLKKIKSQNPDLIFAPVHLTEAGLFVYQAMKMKIRSSILGADGWGGSELLNNYARNLAKNCYFSAPWSDQIKTKINSDFMENFSLTFGQKASIDGGSAQAYDAVYLLAAAIKKSNSADPVKIRDALASTSDFKGTSGIISYKNKQDPSKSVFINEMRDEKIFLFKEINP